MKATVFAEKLTEWVNRAGFCDESIIDESLSPEAHLVDSNLLIVSHEGKKFAINITPINCSGGGCACQEHGKTQKSSS